MTSILKRALSLAILFVLLLQSAVFAEEKAVQDMADRYEDAVDAAKSVEQMLVYSDLFTNEMLLYVAGQLLDATQAAELLTRHKEAFDKARHLKAFSMDEDEVILRNIFYLIHDLATALDSDSLRASAIQSVREDFEKDYDKLKVEEKLQSALYRSVDMLTILVLVVDGRQQYTELIGGIFDEFVALDEKATNLEEQMVIAYQKMMEMYSVLVLIKDTYGEVLNDLKSGNQLHADSIGELDEGLDLMTNSSRHAFEVLKLLAQVLAKK